MAPEYRKLYASIYQIKMTQPNLFIKNYTKSEIDEKKMREVAVSFFQYQNLPDMYLEIIFVGVDRIKKLNRQNRGVNKPTDVLSFPILPQPAHRLPDYQITRLPESALGSIIICPMVAKKRGERIIELMVHGLIHLIGYDHEKESDYDKFCKINEEFWTRISRG